MSGSGAAPVVGLLLTLAVLLAGRSRPGMPPAHVRPGQPARWAPGEGSPRGVPGADPSRAAPGEGPSRAAPGGGPSAGLRSVLRAGWPGRRRSADRGNATARTCETLDLCVAGLRAGMDLPAVVAFTAREVSADSDVVDVLAGEVTDRHTGGRRARPAREGDGRPASELTDVITQARELSQACGIPLADAWETASNLLREREALRRKVVVALAGPRATMRVLTLLPLAGPVVGLVFGIDPWRLYAASPISLGCLCLGLVLLGLGRWWCDRLVRRLGLAGLT